MASPESELEKQSALILEHIHEEAHCFLIPPLFWSGHGRHIDFESSALNPRTLFPKQILLRRTASSTIIQTDFKQVSIAQKLVNPAAERDKTAFLKAVRRLEEVEHRHLILTLGSFTETNDLLGLLLFPCAACDLGFVLEELEKNEDDLVDIGQQLGVVVNKNRDDTRWRLRVYLQRLYGCLANAVEYLHSQSMCIKELKPEHILLSRDGPCLTDFGLPKPSPPKRIAKDIYRYYAPEANLAVEPTLPSDVFSLACCFLEICTVSNGLLLVDLRRMALPKGFDNWGTPAYKHNITGLYSWIEKLRSRKEVKELSQPYSELDLFKLMLRENPSLRPTARKVMFYLDCIEGDDLTNTTGCIYHNYCCRPRRFETVERIKAQRQLREIHSEPGQPTPQPDRQAKDRTSTNSTEDTTPVPDSVLDGVPDSVLDDVPDSVPDSFSISCPFLVCMAGYNPANNLYSHIQDYHGFWLSDAHKYKCPSCLEVNGASLDNFRTHLEQHHAIPDRTALFNRSIYGLLYTNVDFRGKWKLVVPTRGIEKV